MDSHKTYGRDGPPQLQGRVEEVPTDVLEEWIATGEERLWRTFRNTDWWRKRIRCTCGCTDAFEVRAGDARLPGWKRGKFGGIQRTDLTCAVCGDHLPLFDDGVHGYNAVVCDDRAHLPTDYLRSNEMLLGQLLCDCGSHAFSVIVEVMYDCDDDEIKGIPQSQWDEAYGSFGACARCSSCGKVYEIANAETA